MAIFRKAKMSDVESLHDLINYFADQGLMLPRSRNTLYENLWEFTVIEAEGRIIGAGSLHIIWDGLAEIRALAVIKECQGRGLGKQLVNILLEEARKLEISRVFSLTYQVEFFSRCGFVEISKDQLSHKVWKDCINCPKFPNCDEVAMIYYLQ